ncbi:MAG: hypothetical protein MUC50_03550 [Myxococcota bacterium]|jgi:hypothetical protein|nr:hypothetical protein [Myxococcota bacterium]
MSRTPILLLVLGFVSLVVACVGDETDSANDDMVSTFDVSEDCQSYLKCMSIADAKNVRLYEATYGEGGECWSGSSSVALGCTQTCQVSLKAAFIEHPEVEECWLDGSPDMRLVFGTRPNWDWENGQGCNWTFDVQTRFYPQASAVDFSMFFEFFDGSVGNWSSRHECTQTGWTFTCAPYDNSGVETFTFSGVFKDAFESGRLQLDVSWAEGSATCTWTGAPS